MVVSSFVASSASINVGRNFLGDPDAKTEHGPAQNRRLLAIIEPPAAKIFAVSVVSVAVVMILAL